MSPNPVNLSALPHPRQRITLPLHWVLILPFFIQLVGTVSLVGWLSFRNGNAAVTTLATQLREAATARVEEHLEAYLEPPVAVVQSNAAAIQLGQLSIDQLATARTYFARQLAIYPSLDGIYLANQQGQFLCLCGASKGEPVEKLVESVPQRLLYDVGPDGERGDLIEEDQYDPRQRPWYQKVQQRRQPAWSEVYSFTDGELGITAAAPIWDASAALAGVAGVDLRLTQIHDFLAQLAVSPNAQVFIVDREGRLIASSDDRQVSRTEAGDSVRLRAVDSANPMIQATAQHLALGPSPSLPSTDQAPGQALDLALDPALDPALGPALDQEPDPASSFQLGGEQYFVQSVSYGDRLGLDWRIVVVMPKSDFMAQINANTRTTLQLCILALVLSVLAGLLLARALSVPFQRANLGAIAIAAGQFHHRLPKSRIREVSLLSEAFEHMGYQLQASFSALEDVNFQLETANAQLETANAQLEMRVEQRTAELVAEQVKSEKLLLNILPASIAEQLKHSQEPIAQSFDQVTILFADLVGFTPLAARYSATGLVELLNRLFCEFDALAERHGLEKIKTIGDAYMVAAGLPQPRLDHGAAIARMALDMQQAIAGFSSDLDAPLSLRIGINSGSVVGGVIGSKKFIYDVWGDAVNIASRMESSSQPGRIQVSQSTFKILRGQGFELHKRGRINIKGRGLMLTYWLEGDARTAPALSQSEIVAQPPHPFDVASLV